MRKIAGKFFALLVIAACAFSFLFTILGGSRVFAEGSDDDSTDAHYSISLKWDETDKDKLYNIKTVTTSNNTITAQYVLTINNITANYDAEKMEIRLPYYLLSPDRHRVMIGARVIHRWLLNWVSLRSQQ